MADQWEYFIARLALVRLDTKSTESRYQLGLLTSEGAPTDTYLDAPAALNQFGSQGWELVSTGNLSDGYGTGASYLIFKRRKP